MNNNNLANIQKALIEISKEAKMIMGMVFDSDIGLNKKTGKNTLKTSDLRKSIQPFTSNIDNTTLVGIIVNDYIEYINSGRRKGAYVPIQVLTTWAKKNNIPTDNKTIYAINRSIYLNGIQPRKVIDGWYSLIDEKYWDEWADKLFITITEELNKIFK